MRSYTLSIPFLAASTVSAAFTYSGCYRSSQIRDSLEHNNDYIYQSSSYCENACSGSSLAALVNGNGCFCGDAEDISDLTSVSDSNCNVRCAGYGLENCGGSQYFSVYTDDSEEEVDNNTTESESPTTSTSSTRSSSSSSSSSSESQTSEESSTSATTTSSTSSSSTTSVTSTTDSSSSTETPNASTTSHSTESSSSSTEITVVTITASNSQTVVTRTASASASPALDASARTSNSRSSISKGAIAGIVVGVVLGVAAIIGAILFCLYRRRQNNIEDHTDTADSDKMIQDFVQNNAYAMKRRSSASTISVFGDYEKAGAANDSYDTSESRGKRRFSDESLPDARDNSGSGLRVMNPDL